MTHVSADRPAPFACHNGASSAFPVLLSVPHAGRDYPAEVVANLRVAPSELVRLEDRYADRLVQGAIADGFSAIIAHRARAAIDLNRAETDIDSGMFSGGCASLDAKPGVKARGGLGLFPRRLQNCGELWRAPMEESEAVSRIAQLHRPYHDAVAAQLSAMRACFGFAVLIDVHSMPPLTGAMQSTAADGLPPQIVIGDRFGRSAASFYAELVAEHCTRRGWRAGLNSPYSGDYILQRHGQPHRDIHAIQIEIDRSLYLDAALREPSEGLGRVADFLTQIVQDIASHRQYRIFAEAAE